MFPLTCQKYLGSVGRKGEVDEFYRELQSLVDETPKQDILVVQGDWKFEKMHKRIREKFMDLSGIRRPMTEGSSS